ncbi:hypothetical protein ACPXCE_17900 [Streptomyces sp. DT24]|nr:hypothetical protein [Streptomyces sp. AM 4-1-1]WEH32112.1 hypothetical protein PZB75_01180 [Streptomyces sp. AM 4-1-1]
MKEAAAALGVRAVLLAYWGTASTLARWFAKPRRGGDESVRPKA